MNKVLFLKKISETMEDQNLFKKAEEFGEKAANSNISKSQMSNLKNIANTTFKVSEILDYIKKQIAREKYWKNFGEELLNFMNNDLSKLAEKLNQDLKEEYSLREVKLQLLREFINSLVVNFEYYMDKKGSLKNGR